MANLKSSKYNTIFVFLFFLSFFFYSCRPDEDVPVPKPKGYIRLTLPQREYKIFDSIYPYSFKYNFNSAVVPDTSRLSEKYWMNIVYPELKAKIHISYKKVNKNLSQYTEDSRIFVNKHIQKASKIEQKKINIPENNVYGIIYSITGTKAASVLQFYVTDSITNFIRGALYFSLVPNNDSIAPIIEYISVDIDTFIRSLKWKKLN